MFLACVSSSPPPFLCYAKCYNRLSMLGGCGKIRNKKEDFGMKVA
jgi:hypothetical protein